MTIKPPAESDGEGVAPGSPDNPDTYDTTDPYFEDKEGSGKQLAESIPPPFKRLVEVYRTIEAQGRYELGVLFVREHAKAAEPEEDNEVPADFVGDLSDFDDNPPGWIRRNQDKYLGLIVCYLDSKGREDWNIPSTALVFCVEWIEGFDEWECAQWSVRLPGVLGESPNRSEGCKVLSEEGVEGLLEELRATLDTPFPE
jgi:hypothetical protein